MKQFIYLDNDIIASIIAQAEKGLITKMMDEHGNSSSEEQTTSISANTQAGISGGLLKVLHGEASLGAEGQSDTSNALQRSSKEIAEKTLHDASFDIACGYIDLNEADSKQDTAGDYIKLKRVFTFADLDYLEGLFSKGGVIEYLKKMTGQDIKEKMTTSQVNNNQGGQASKKRIENAVAQNNKQYDDALTFFRLLKGLVPYSRMLISSDGYLVPLDDKYFRIDPSNLGFKYGGEITCVGLITNIIGESTDPGNDGDFFTLIQFSANEVLRAILPTKDKDLCVVHPIAVYYGE